MRAVTGELGDALTSLEACVDVIVRYPGIVRFRCVDRCLAANRNVKSTRGRCLCLRRPHSTHFGPFDACYAPPFAPCCVSVFWPDFGRIVASGKSLLVRRLEESLAVRRRVDHDLVADLPRRPPHDVFCRAVRVLRISRCSRTLLYEHIGAPKDSEASDYFLSHTYGAERSLPSMLRSW